MEWKIESSWQAILSDEFEKDYFHMLEDLLDEEYAKYEVFPKAENIFSAFNYSSFDNTKVVMIGQDPYHDVNQAHGLCFSVQKGIKIPPSLRNMYKELESDLGIEAPKHGQLTDWAKQGILMINACLTVRAHEAGSHSKYGWQTFTDQVIRVLNEREKPVIFVLWGNFAKSKKAYISQEQHFIIESPHPSPLSARRGFFGSRPYSQINKILEDLGEVPIHWHII